MSTTDNQSDDFRKGVRALYDEIFQYTSNNWHPNLEKNKTCTQNNLVIEQVAFTALSTVSPEDASVWVDIDQLLLEIKELKREVHFWKHKAQTAKE